MHYNIIFSVSYFFKHLLYSIKSNNLKKEVKSQKNKLEEFKEIYGSELQEKDKKIKEYHFEISQLKMKLEEKIKEDNQYLKLQSVNKVLEEKLHILENKYSRITNEYMEFKQKSQEEDESKSKLNSIIKSKNEKIDTLKNEIKKTINDKYGSLKKFFLEWTNAERKQVIMDELKLQGIDISV